MRAVVQKTLSSSVTSEGVETGRIGQGLTVLLGVAADDDEKDVQYMVDKIARMRVFEDEAGKLNLSLLDVQGELMVVSQFTLYGDIRHGRRPSFIQAAPPEMAEKLYSQFVTAIKVLGIHTETGRFRTEMIVSLQNHGPVTILVDSKKAF